MIERVQPVAGSSATRSQLSTLNDVGENWDLRTKQRQLYWAKDCVPDQVALMFTDADLQVRIAPTTDG